MLSEIAGWTPPTVPSPNLEDDGGLWATSYAVTELNDQAEKTMTMLVKKAVS